MRILLSGSAGYTGRGIGQILAADPAITAVRGLDVRPSEAVLQESLVGDLADLATCLAAVQGVDAVVMCHMAPNPSGYETPVQAIDVNVKGMANLFHAMAQQGLKRVVLISTTGVLCPLPQPAAIIGAGPYHLGPKQTMYGLSKIMQEVTACHYFHTAGIVTTALRPGWIVYDQTLITKYGQTLEMYDPGLVDPRDIGRAVLAALRLPEPALEAFPLAQDDAPADQSATRTRLGWRPQFNFTALRKPA